MSIEKLNANDYGSTKSSTSKNQTSSKDSKSSQPIFNGDLGDYVMNDCPDGIDGCTVAHYRKLNPGEKKPDYIDLLPCPVDNNQISNPVKLMPYMVNPNDKQINIFGGTKTGDGEPGPGFYEGTPTDKYSINGLINDESIEKLKELGAKTPSTATEATSEEKPSVLGSIGNFFKNLFKDEKEPEKPNTPEFSEAGDYMNQKMAEYDAKNPEPEIKQSDLASASFGFPPSIQAHNKWAKSREEYIKALETTYRQDHPEYAKQAENYEEEKKKYDQKHMLDCGIII